MGQRSPFTPQEIKPPTSGPSPSIAPLLAMVDTADPAFLCIVEVIKDMRAAGFDLNAETVSMAVALGRQKRSRSRAHGRRDSKTPAALGSIVYYIRRGAAIKIGTTVEPRKRFASLMPDEILAVEPGGVDHEFARHMQFAHLRIGSASEYFHPEAELMEHIAEVRLGHGQPDPTWPSLARTRDKEALTKMELPEPVSDETATVAEGARRLGIKQFTVYGWARRGRMPVAGIDQQNRKLYYLEHMAKLHELHQPWRRQIDPRE